MGSSFPSFISVRDVACVAGGFGDWGRVWAPVYVNLGARLHQFTDHSPALQDPTACYAGYPGWEVQVSFFIGLLVYCIPVVFINRVRTCKTVNVYITLIDWALETVVRDLHARTDRIQWTRNSYIARDIAEFSIEIWSSSYSQKMRLHICKQHTN